MHKEGPWSLEGEGGRMGGVDRLTREDAFDIVHVS